MTIPYKKYMQPTITLLFFIKIYQSMNLSKSTHLNSIY